MTDPETLVIALNNLEEDIEQLTDEIKLLRHDLSEFSVVWDGEAIDEMKSLRTELRHLRSAFEEAQRYG